MPIIRATDNSIEVELWGDGLIHVSIKSHDPVSALTPTQARRLATALIETVEEEES